MKIWPARPGYSLSWPGCCHIDPKLGLPGLAWGCFYIDPGQVGPASLALSSSLHSTTPTGFTPALAFEQRGCVLQLPLSLAESHEKQSAQYFWEKGALVLT